MKNFILLACTLCSAITLAQDVTWNGHLRATGIFSSEDTLPFWLYTNTNTEIGQETDYAGLASIQASYQLKDSVYLNADITAMARNGFEDDIQRRDLYLQFKNTWLKATLGSKAAAVAFNGLSASNKNFIFSTNARPLPGVLLEANKPLAISKTFAIDWGIGHYMLNDNRYIDDVRVHYKRLGLITTLNDKSKLSLQLQHYAQWAGTAPDGAELQNDFDAFTNVFIASKGDKDGSFGEALNAVGNHLGTYFIQYEMPTKHGRFAAYHDHPFEDGSGTRFANFPDGIWGISFEPTNQKLITQVIYEYIDSSDQSGTDGNSGFDGYFGNSTYRSGWTYEGQVIGLPFILNDPSIVLNDMNSQFISNRSRVHHLGLMGSVKQFDWKVKTSYFTNFGTYRKPFDPTVNSWLNYASVAYKTTNYGTFTLLGAFDVVDVSDNNAALAFQYSYSF